MRATLSRNGLATWIGCACALLVAATASADTTWTGGSSGDWQTGANWSDGVPDSADAVTIAGPSPSYWPAITSGSGAGQTLDLGSATGSTATLSIATQLTTTDAYIGNASGETGGATVSGSGANWTNTGLMHVGSSGSGELLIDSDATTDFGDVYVGRYATGDGTVTVSGGAICNATILAAAAEGHGEIVIETAGAVYGNYGAVGGSSGTAVVRGAGSTWVLDWRFYVGADGNGELTISDGGTVNAAAGIYLGAFDDASTGVALVTGAGSMWYAAFVSIGDTDVDGSGKGELTIADGGFVAAFSGLSIDLDTDRGSFIHMTGGGMLALGGDADDSIDDFLDLIGGTDAVYYWNGSAWAPITAAVRDVDYTLVYHASGDLAGLTVLTVPEPTTLTLLTLGATALLPRRKHSSAQARP